MGNNLDKDIEIVKTKIEYYKYNPEGCNWKLSFEDTEDIKAIENVLSEFKQLIDISADTVFERNNFEVEALARKLYKLGIIQKEGNIYRYSKKIERKEAGNEQM